MPARYSRTTNGLLASLIVTVLAVGGFVVFRAAFRDQPEHRARTRSTTSSTVEAAQDGGIELVYPARAPRGLERHQHRLRPR